MNAPTLFEEVPAPVAGALPSLALPEPLLVITARGVPGPQGSKTRTASGGMRESSAKVKPWRAEVAWRTLEARTKRRGWRPLLGPVALSVVFTFDRPKSHYGKGRNASRLLPSAPVRPDVKPDLDKVLRATKDALTEGGAYRDDAQVVEMLRLGKWYATDHGRVPDVLDGPGAVIRVWSLAAGGDG
ncbi:RusA family crossover junction endodeoxyribonuclease [Streptomyces sp. NPDC006207]